MSYENYPIYINSKDRLNPQDPTSQVLIKFTDYINIHSKKNIKISVPYCFIPGTYYNVTDLNHSITYTEFQYPGNLNPQTKTVTIPNGNYDINGFIQAFTNVLTVNSSYGLTYIGSYNVSTGKLTIALAGNDPNHTFTWTFRGSNRDLKYFMGFNDSFNNLTVPPPADLSPAQPNYSYTSPVTINFLASVPAIYLRSTILNSNSVYDTSVNNQIGNILKVFPITGGPFSAIEYQAYEVEHERLQCTNNIMNTQVMFTLTTEDPTEIIDLNGYDWQFEVLVQFY